MSGSISGGPHLSDRQRLDWLRLIRSDNVGPATFRDLINHFGSAAAALDALPRLMQRAGGRRLRIHGRDEALREIDMLTRRGARLVAAGEPGYPPLLGHIDAPPPLLAVDGGFETAASPFFERRAVALVGARNASAAGRKMAEILAAGLGQAGFVIVSGLARGIDASSHSAALATGTIAVIAGGLDKLYPPENLDLARRIIAEGGAIVTEMPLGHEARAKDFPRRNRLISGISEGTVIVEAALRSGSLHTARFAADQGREVMAVPGSPLDPRAEGANSLIKDGASMVTTVDDVIAALGRDGGRRAMAPDFFAEDESPPPHFEIDDPARRRILTALGPVPMQPDEIARIADLPGRVAAMVFLELDIAGRLERHADGSLALISADPSTMPSSRA